MRIGVSSCLLGQKVRFDGGHKRDAFLVDTFGRHVEWVPVCPEVEVGHGDAARAAFASFGRTRRVRLVGVKSGTDHTAGDARVGARGGPRRSRGEDLDGYVLKKDSPSCGMERVKVYDPHGCAGAHAGAGCSPRP